MDWQPIETAPKDGTEILVWNEVSGPYRTAYQDRINEYEGRWPMGFCGRIGVWFPSPTHWMPLPKPPNSVLNRHLPKQ